MDGRAQGRYRLLEPIAQIPLTLVVATLVSAVCAAAGFMYGHKRDIPEPAASVEVRAAPAAAGGNEITVPSRLELPRR